MHAVQSASSDPQHHTSSQTAPVTEEACVSKSYAVQSLRYQQAHVHVCNRALSRALKLCPDGFFSGWTRSTSASSVHDE